MRRTHLVASALPLLLAAAVPAAAPAQQVLSFTRAAGVNAALGNSFTFDFGGGITALATAYRLSGGLLSTPAGAEDATLATKGSTAPIPLAPDATFDATGLGLRCLVAASCPTLDADDEIGAGYAVVLDFGATNVGSFVFAGVQAQEGVQFYSSPTFQSSFGLWNFVGAGTGPNVPGTALQQFTVATPERFYLVTATLGDALITAATVPGVSAVPEPSTGVLAATALVALTASAGVARRRRRSG